MSETKIEKPGRLKLIKDFFGLREGGSMTQFAQEYKALTEQDKTDLAEGIENGTLSY